MSDQKPTTRQVAEVLASGASLVNPEQLKRFGIDIGKPQHEIYDAPWSSYKGMGLSVVGGVAVLEIIGPLTFKLGWQVGYDELSEALTRIESDNSIKAVMLNIHSPGGLVSGCFDFCDQLHALAQKMPVKALVADVAASAAYAIASQCNEIVLNQTSMVGSIGVVMTHMDYSEQAKQIGVKPTYIYAGQHKTDGFPLEPLSEDAKASIQAEVDEIYEVFVSKVERGRSLTVEQIKATEAAVYIGEKAVEAGLADRILSGQVLLKEMQRDISNGAQHHTTMEAGMAEEKPETTVSNEKEVAAAVEAAVKADRERVEAITGSEEAKGREALASHLALKTSMSIEDAKEALKASPQAAAQSTLDAAMESQDSGLSPEGEANVAPITINAQAIFAKRAEQAKGGV